MGARDGAAVGALDGAAVGALDGAAVGALDGAAVGALDGAAVGAFDGAVVGALDVGLGVAACEEWVVSGLKRPSGSTALGVGVATPEASGGLATFEALSGVAGFGEANEAANSLASAPGVLSK